MDLLETFMHVFNKMNTLNNHTFDYGSGDFLFPSEIHTLNTIAKNPGGNVTELAKTLGISKSAVSQVVFKLEQKGFLVKYKADNNSKNIFANLTPKGDAAVKSFTMYQNDVFTGMLQDFAKLTPEEIFMLKNIFENIDHHMDLKLEKYIYSKDSRLSPKKH
jgi:DNA-binding MarR family transcriptional regulator